MRRVVSFVLAGVAGLVALVVATATSTVADYYARLTAAAALQPVRLDGVVILVAGVLTAGAIYALFLLGGRLPRTLLVGLGLLSLAMLVIELVLLRQSGMAQQLGLGPDLPGQHDDVAGTTFLLQRAWARYAVPTAAGAVLAVAVVVTAATRRPVVLYLTPYAPPPRGPSVLGGLLAVVAGAAVWALTGLGLVCIALLAGIGPFDWYGRDVERSTVEFGSSGVLGMVAGASIVVAGLLYAGVMARRLHWGVPVLVGVVFAGVTVWSIVEAVARIGTAAPGGQEHPTSALLSAVAFGAQAVSIGPGALLCVPLLVAGLRRRSALQVAAGSSADEDTLVW